jgi:hypothetical protein
MDDLDPAHQIRLPSGVKVAAAVRLVRPGVLHTPERKMVPAAPLGLFAGRGFNAFVDESREIPDSGLNVLRLDQAIAER